MHFNQLCDAQLQYRQPARPCIGSLELELCPVPPPLFCVSGRTLTVNSKQYSRPQPLSVNPCASGVSQRDVTQHYPALADEADELEEMILEFFEEHVQHKFPDPDCKLSCSILCL